MRNLQSWITLVVQERARILARVAPVPTPVSINPVKAKEAIYRAAAALLEWEAATGDLLGDQPDNLLTPTTQEESNETQKRG